jgi:hypothetical protein
MVADALTGLFLVVALAVALTAALSSQRRASTRLADERKAVRVAEHELLNLQTGAARGTSSSGDVTIDVKPLNDAPAPPGTKWVTVKVTVCGRSAELSGLVPKEVSP